MVIHCIYLMKLANHGSRFNLFRLLNQQCKTYIMNVAGLECGATVLVARRYRTTQIDILLKPY